MRDDLSNLIARIEAASEGSRDLDAMVHVATFDHAPFARGVGVALSDCGAEAYHGFIRHRAGSITYSAASPEFTSSLDAALLLVPEGWGSCPHQYNDGAWQWKFWRFSDLKVVKSACVKSPALALVAAALRARSMT